MTADHLIPDDLAAGRQDAYDRGNVSTLRAMLELADPDAADCCACWDEYDDEGNPETHWTGDMHAWTAGSLDPPWPWLGLPRDDVLPLW